MGYQSVGTLGRIITEGATEVKLFGEKIKLTELEYALFALLFERDGFVSREEIPTKTVAVNRWQVW